jgi:hypothetical protein
VLIVIPLSLPVLIVQFQAPPDTKPLIELRDPNRSQQALLGLLCKGNNAVPELAEFLLTSKPSVIAESNLLAASATLLHPDHHFTTKTEQVAVVVKF